MVFHLECFKCHACKRKLGTGDTCVLRGDTMLCSEHGEVHVTMDEPDNVSGMCSRTCMFSRYERFT